MKFGHTRPGARPASTVASQFSTAQNKQTAPSSIHVTGSIVYRSPRRTDCVFDGHYRGSIVYRSASVMTITMDHRISSGIAHIMPAFQHIVPCAHCVRLCIRQGNTSSLYHRAHHASQPRAHCSFVYPARERKFSVRMLFMCIRQGNASSLSVCCSCVSGKGTQVLDRMLSCSALINIIRRRERLNP